MMGNYPKSKKNLLDYLELSEDTVIDLILGGIN